MLAAAGTVIAAASSSASSRRPATPSSRRCARGRVEHAAASTLRAARSGALLDRVARARRDVDRRGGGANDGIGAWD